MPKKASLAAKADLDRDTLAAEAKRFGRYLVGEVPPDEFVGRYVKAHEARWEDLLIPSPALGAVTNHPWLLPWLDAACAIVQPDDPLRRKLLLMTAVLECSPRYAHRFLPKRKRLPALLLEVAWLGLHGAVRIAGGLVIYQWILRQHRNA